MKSAEEFVRELWFGSTDLELEAAIKLVELRELEIAMAHDERNKVLLDAIEKIAATVVSSTMADFMELPFVAYEALEKYRGLDGK